MDTCCGFIDAVTPDCAVIRSYLKQGRGICGSHPIYILSSRQSFEHWSQLPHLPGRRFPGDLKSRELAMGRPRLPGAICSWEAISPSREGLRGKCSWEILATRRRALLGGFSRERILYSRRCLGDPHSWKICFSPMSSLPL